MIPVFPDRFDAEGTQGSGYLARLALVADVELLQRLRIGVVASRIGLALRAHRGYAEARHVVAEGGTLAGGIGDIDIVVEDAGGEGDLCQLTVAHHDVGLEAAILRGAHPREVEAVFRFPIMLLQVAQVMRHHGDVGAPLLFQSHQDTHADGVHAGLPHTVEAVHAPLEVGLHAAGMVDVIIRLVIGLLKTDHAVHAVVRQLLIFLHGEGHHLDLQVGEIGARQVERTGEVGHAGLHRVLARHDQQVLERAELLDGLVFVDHLLLRQDDALHGVAHVKTAIDARVGAGVGDIERDEDLHRVAKPLTGIAIAQLRHRLQIGLSGGGDQGHEVLHVEVALRQCPAYIRVALGVDGLRRGIPINLF